MPRRNKDKYGKSYNSADGEMKDWLNFINKR